jgi:hypothetical protein
VKIYRVPLRVSLVAHIAARSIREAHTIAQDQFGGFRLIVRGRGVIDSRIEREAVICGPLGINAVWLENKP